LPENVKKKFDSVQSIKIQSHRQNNLTQNSQNKKPSEGTILSSVLKNDIGSAQNVNV